ncbi:hypothetical protein [Streptomyces canus]|uniref:hypothetical protein n=1 Tax=Streptomyces canus TaxID=58343 RepID=UPI0037F7DC0A
MSWTRGLIALLAVCVVLMTGSVSCGASGAQERKDGQSVSPVGKVLDDTDEEGRHYREVDKGNAPDVGIELQPTTDDSWSVRLTVENFTFSPAGTRAKAVSGRGVAVVFVDDRPVTTLRTPSCRLAAAYVPQGTHKVTARLYADDGTVWAVDGDPVESTADVTASEPQPTGSAGGGVPGAESTAGTGDEGAGAESTAGTGGEGAGAEPGASAVGTTSDVRFTAGRGGSSGVGLAVRVGDSATGERLVTSSGETSSEFGPAASAWDSASGAPIAARTGGGR